jgi:hypothetical protein
VSDYLIYQTIFHSLLCGKEVIALGVNIDLLDALAGVLRKNGIELFPCSDKVIGVYLNIGTLTAQTAADKRLVDHYLAVRESKALALSSA